MFKTLLILNETKIKSEGLYSVSQCKSKLEEICNKEHLYKDKYKDNLFVLDSRIDSLGTRLTLLGKLQKSNLLYYLKEWKNYDDEESPNGELEESDMLKTCKKRGLLNGENEKANCF